MQIKKWRQQDLNLRPFARQANALPLSYVSMIVLYQEKAGKATYNIAGGEKGWERTAPSYSIPTSP